MFLTRWRIIEYHETSPDKLQPIAMMRVQSHLSVREKVAERDCSITALIPGQRPAWPTPLVLLRVSLLHLFQDLDDSALRFRGFEYGPADDQIIRSGPDGFRRSGLSDRKSTRLNSS